MVCSRDRSNLENSRTGEIQAKYVTVNTVYIFEVFAAGGVSVSEVCMLSDDLGYSQDGPLERVKVPCC